MSTTTDTRPAMHRVAVVGSGGAGKTTFAAELGRRTGLPVIHLDRHYWRPGWVETPGEEWHAVQSRLAARDRWIIDGNYGSSLDLRLARADIVIVLALPRWRCVLRVVRRWIMSRGRAMQAEGCPERVGLEFLRWIWRYPIDSRPVLDAAFGRCENCPRVIELRSAAQVRAFLEKVGD